MHAALSLEESGLRFLESPFAEAILQMPNCIPLGLNPNHTQFFRNGTLPVLTSLEQYKNVVTGSKVTSEGRPLCYCSEDGIRAIIALDKDCVFTTLHARLLENNGNHVETGFEFHRMRDGAVRRYYISRVIASLLARHDAHDVLHVTLRPNADFSLEVRSIPGTGTRPKELVTSIFLGDKEISPEQSHRIDVKEDSEYIVAEKLLQEASQANRDLSQRLHQLSKDFNLDNAYPQVYDLVREILSNGSSPAEQQEKLHSSQRALFDGRIVRENNKRLSEALETQEIIEKIKDFEKEIQGPARKALIDFLAIPHNGRVAEEVFGKGFIKSIHIRSQMANEWKAKYEELYAKTGIQSFLVVASILTNNPSISASQAYHLDGLFTDLAVYEQDLRIEHRNDVEDRIEEIESLGLGELLTPVRERIKKVDVDRLAKLKGGLTRYKSLEDFIERNEIASSTFGFKRGRWWNYPISEGYVTIQDLCDAFNLSEEKVTEVIRAYEIST